MNVMRQASCDGPPTVDLLCFGALSLAFFGLAGAPLLSSGELGGAPDGGQGSPNSGLQACLELANGDFSKGLLGWQPDPTVVGFGGGAGQAGIDVIDLRALGGTSDAACLGFVATVEWDPARASGSARQAQSLLRRSAVVRSPELEFLSVGQFEVIAFSEASFRFDAQLVIDNGRGNVARIPIAGDQFDNAYPCGNGISAIGVIPLLRTSVDLAAHGIALGDTVSIEVVWSGTVTALDECDLGIVEGILCVDDFRFCSASTAAPAVARRPRWSKLAEPDPEDVRLRYQGRRLVDRVLDAR